MARTRQYRRDSHGRFAGSSGGTFTTTGRAGGFANPAFRARTARSHAGVAYKVKRTILRTKRSEAPTRSRVAGPPLPQRNFPTAKPRMSAADRRRRQRNTRIKAAVQGAAVGGVISVGIYGGAGLMSYGASRMAGRVAGAMASAATAQAARAANVNAPRLRVGPTGLKPTRMRHGAYKITNVKKPRRRRR